MDNNNIVKAMQEFIKDTVSTTKVDKHSIQDAVTDYFSSDFSLEDHLDTYDIRDRVGVWCDDNAGDYVKEHLDSRYMAEMIENAVNDRDLSEDVQSAIENNMDNVIESIDYKRLACAIIQCIKEESNGTN
jgi:ribosomal protein S3AE